MICTTDLIIFEPGTNLKLDQTLQAILRLGSCDRPGRIWILGTNHAINEKIASDLYACGIEIRVLEDPALYEPSTFRRLGSGHTNTLALFAPFELTTQQAAAFAVMISDQLVAPYNSLIAVRISRDKATFRNFVKQLHCEGLWDTNHSIVRLDDGLVVHEKLSQILDIIENDWNLESKSSGRLVVKPLNAGASIGVRSLPLSDSQESVQVLSQVIESVVSLGKTLGDYDLEQSWLLVEPWAYGDEFSVEGYVKHGKPTVVAINWKPDIEACRSLFLERTFVTLSPITSEYSRIADFANQLVVSMNVVTGTFHAEFRVEPSGLNRIYPLEVGLRPGGGVVTPQVEFSCGPSMYDFALSCALDISEPQCHEMRVTASSTIFSSNTGRLMPLSYTSASGQSKPINWRLSARIKDDLQEVLIHVNRTEASRRLAHALQQQSGAYSSLRSEVLRAFNPVGQGLWCDVMSIEPWLKQGTRIVEREASYVGGITVTARKQCGQGFAAMAEAVAAVILLQDSIVCQCQP